MRSIRLFFGAIPPAIACLCVSTTVAQAIGMILLFATDSRTPEKMVRYAAVAYGLDLTTLPLTKANADGEELNELMTREQIIQSQVERSALLKDREEAIENGVSGVRSSFQNLRVEHNRFEERKEKFEARLIEREKNARAEAITEVQRTLAVLQPKQVKTILIRMLEDQGLDPDDDVMEDVVTMIKEMPPSALSPIFSFRRLTKWRSWQSER